MNDLIQQHLHRESQRMKVQADKNCSECSFEVGLWVFLKLQPYVQTSLGRRSCQKLSFKFFGPIKIVEKVGAVAYCLALPASSQIHPVFHVSQLKADISSVEEVVPVLPKVTTPYQVPKAILQTHFSARGASRVSQVMVKWPGMAKELATWKDLEALSQQFRGAPAWEQPGSFREGMLALLMILIKTYTGARHHYFSWATTWALLEMAQLEGYPINFGFVASSTCVCLACERGE